MSERQVGWIRKFWRGRSYAFIAVDMALPKKDYYWRLPDNIDRSKLEFMMVVRFTPVRAIEAGKKNIAANVEIVE